MRCSTRSRAPASTPARSRTCIMGGAIREGTTGGNIARADRAARRAARSPYRGVTINRFCSSGLQTIAHGRAAHHRRRGRPVIVAGGVESISCVQNEINQHMRADPWLAEHKPEHLLEHAADRREGRASATTSRSERRTNTACAASSAPARRSRPGKFNDEIVPMTVDHGRGRQGHRPLRPARRSRSTPTKASAPTPRWRRVSEPALGAARRHRHRRQCQPVQRRRVGAAW